MTKKIRKPKKSIFSKGSAVAEAEAQKAQQRELEQMKREHMIARTEYELKCNDLGIMEVAVLEMGRGGIMPKVELQGIPPEQQEAMRSRLEAELEDLLVMTGRKQPKESSGLVGTDGQPIAPVEPEEQPEEADSEDVTNVPIEEETDVQA